MTDRNSRDLLTKCKDKDGILPIRKEAWELQESLPSTSGNQLTTDFGSSFPTPMGPGSQQTPEGYPFPFQNTLTIQPVQNQPGNIYGISSPAQSTLPFEQNQYTHLGHAQHKGFIPVMAPIIWYYPCCRQCQHFLNQHHQ